MSFKELYDVLSNYWTKPPKSGFLYNDKLDNQFTDELDINSILITPSLSHSAIGKAINDGHELVLTLFPLSYSSGNPMRNQAFTLMKDAIKNNLLVYSLDTSWFLDLAGGLGLFAQFLDGENTTIISTSSGKKAGLLGVFPHIHEDFISSLSKISPLIIGKPRVKPKDRLNVLFYSPFSADEYLTNDELKEIIEMNKINVLVSTTINESLAMTCFEASSSFLFVPLYSVANTICRKLMQLISIEFPNRTISYLPEKRVDISVLALNDNI